MGLGEGRVSGPRRIAIVVHATVPGDTRIHRQSDALSDRRGLRVDVLCLRRPARSPEERGGAPRIVRLPIDRASAASRATWPSTLHSPPCRLAACPRAPTAPYDLVQAATVPDFLDFAALPEKLAGVPLLLDLHEDMPEFFRDRFRHPLVRPLLPLVPSPPGHRLRSPMS